MPEPNAGLAPRIAFRALPSDSEAFRGASVSFLSHFSPALSLSASFARSPIETSRAAATSRTVAQVGLAWPRSMRDSVGSAIPALSASAVCVEPPFSRSCRIAFPSAGWGRSECRIGRNVLRETGRGWRS